MGVVDKLRLGFIAPFFSDAHQHGKFSLEVHIIEDLLWLVCALLLLLLSLVELTAHFLVSSVMLLTSRASCIFVRRLDILISLRMVLGVRGAVALLNAPSCLVHHLVIILTLTAIGW